MLLRVTAQACGASMQLSSQSLCNKGRHRPGRRVELLPMFRSARPLLAVPRSLLAGGPQVQRAALPGGDRQAEVAVVVAVARKAWRRPGDPTRQV